MEQLRFSADHNARMGDDPKGWAEGDEDDSMPGGLPMPVLMATIEAVGGLILPLIVVDMKKRDGQDRPLFSVAAGKRRTTALLSLWRGKRLALALLAANVVSEFYERQHLNVRIESQGQRIASLARGYEEHQTVGGAGRSRRVVAEPYSRGYRAFRLVP